MRFVSLFFLAMLAGCVNPPNGLLLQNYLMLRAASPPPQVQFYPIQSPQTVRLQTMCSRMGTFTYCN
jgi:hypothetical protein